MPPCFLLLWRLLDKISSVFDFLHLCYLMFTLIRISHGDTFFQTLPAHGGNVNAVSFSPDGKVLASFSCSDNRLLMWQVVCSRCHFVKILILLLLMYKICILYSVNILRTL